MANPTATTTIMNPKRTSNRPCSFRIIELTSRSGLAGAKLLVQVVNPPALELFIRKEQPVLHRSGNRLAAGEDADQLANFVHAETVDEIDRRGVSFEVGDQCLLLSEAAPWSLKVRQG